MPVIIAFGCDEGGIFSRGNLRRIIGIEFLFDKLDVCGASSGQGDGSRTASFESI